MSQAGIINVITNNPTIPIYFEEDTGFAVALFNVIKVVGAGGIETSGSGNTITIDGSNVTSNLTITADLGGPQYALANNWTFLNLNTSVQTQGGPGLFITDFSLTNLCFGSSLPVLNVGTGNVGLGRNVLVSLTNGSGNLMLGDLCGQSINVASNNVGAGKNCLISMTNSVQNVAVGPSSLSQLTTSTGSNTALGYASLNPIILGSHNIGIGSTCGSNFTGNESSNIIIGSGGVNGDNNTIRIGTNGNGLGEQNRAFIAGITGVTVAASSPVLVNSIGQLSDLGFGTSGQVLTSNGAGTNPSWQSAVTPKLYAVVSAANVPNLTGDSTQITIIFDSIVYEAGGSNYNAATGIYTVPSDGFYSVQTGVSWQNVGPAHSRSQIDIISSVSVGLAEGNPSASRSNSNGYTQVVAASKFFTAGQTIQILGIVIGSTKTVGYFGTFFGTWTYLSIFKVA